MPRTSALPMPVARRVTLQVRPIRRASIPIWLWLGILSIAIAALLPILQTSDATERGAALRALEREGAALTAEVRLLSSQVGELASLARVDRVARERLGLTPARPTTLLAADTPPPARLLPARLLPPPEPAERESVPWWQRALRLLIFE